jgi:putative tryptophan/tyrosine transport system substrate-binding protein
MSDLGPLSGDERKSDFGAGRSVDDPQNGLRSAVMLRWWMVLGEQMRRRDLIALIGGAAAWPLGARAQQMKMYTIGVLTLTSPDPKQLVEALREGLRDAGYVEGRNLRLEIRSAAGRPDLQLEKAAELVGLKVDLIVTFFTPAALAAKQATRDIPIVMAGAGDPVASGLVASLAQPGGNVTGQSSGGAESL